MKKEETRYNLLTTAWVLAILAATAKTFQIVAWLVSLYGEKIKAYFLVDALVAIGDLALLGLCLTIWKLYMNTEVRRKRLAEFIERWAKSEVEQNK